MTERLKLCDKKGGYLSISPAVLESVPMCAGGLTAALQCIKLYSSIVKAL